MQGCIYSTPSCMPVVLQDMAPSEHWVLRRASCSLFFHLAHLSLGGLHRTRSHPGPSGPPSSHRIPSESPASHFSRTESTPRFGFWHCSKASRTLAWRHLHPSSLSLFRAIVSAGSCRQSFSIYYFCGFYSWPSFLQSRVAKSCSLRSDNKLPCYRQLPTPFGKDLDYSVEHLVLTQCHVLQFC